MSEGGKVADFVAVTLLFRSKTEFTVLPHVVTAVSLFLDCAVELPLHKACKLNSLTLLDRIWTSAEIYTAKTNNSKIGSWTLRKYIRSDRHYRQYQFTLSLIEAIRVQNITIVRWLAARFQGLQVKENVLVEAAAVGSLKILQFFYLSDNSTADSSIRADGVGLEVHWTGNHLTAAVEKRHSAVAWWLASRYPHAEDMSKALNAAVLNGDLPMAEWLLGRGTTWSRGEGLKPAHHAASRGRVDILVWLDTKGQLDHVVGLVVVAAKAGKLHAVRWLIDRDEAIQDKRKKQYLSALGREVSLAIHAAAVNGYLRVVKYLRARTKAPADNLQRAKLALEQTRQVQIMSRLLKVAVPVSSQTMTVAAANGHLDVVKWLYSEYENDLDIDLFDVGDTYVLVNGFAYLYAMDAAASNGHLSVVQYLDELERSIKAKSKKRKRDEIAKIATPMCTQRAMDEAATNGHLEVVKWLLRNRNENCSAYAMYGAAKNGHLDVVKWLQENCSGVSTTRVMDGAAANGHLQVVQWLHFNFSSGCTCTTNAMDGAAENGHLHVVKWLHEHRSEGCTTDAMDHAAINDHLEIVKWLHRNRTEGCTVVLIDEVAQHGNLPLIQWLTSHHIEGCTEAALSGATVENQFEVFLFLHSECHQECTEDHISLAYENFHNEIQDWILEHYPQYRDVIQQDE